MTTQPSTFSTLGIRVYGLAAILLGLIALVWRDFATTWQPVDPAVPHRMALVYLAAGAFLLAGFAVQWRSTAAVGLAILGILYATFACFWMRRVIGFPRMIGTWLGFAEQLSLVLAAVAGITHLHASSSRRALPVARILFGLCPVVFGLAHFVALKETTDFVPHWIPMGQRFWAIATGVFHVLAGLSLVTGVLTRLASRLFTVMILGFGALVWMPMLLASPHTHMVWAGNAVNLSIAGAAWIMADAAAHEKAAR